MANKGKHITLRNKTVKANHMSQEADLYLQGFSMKHIGLELKIDVSTVSRDLALVRERWMTSAVINFTERQGAELAKIDKMEWEYQAGYERSLQKRVTITKRKLPMYKEKKTGRMYVDSEGILKEGKPASHFNRERVGEIVIEEVVKEEQAVGDCKWLDGVLRCIDMRLKIFGLYRTAGITGLPGSGEPAPEDTKIKMALLLGIIGEWEKSLSAGP